MALVGIIVACGAVGLEMAATADPDKLAGEPVPDGDVPAIVEAALSCPTLNPPKLAAQIMAASGFKGSAERIGGLDDAAWQKWRPSPNANRGDRRANIIAVGHRTCENVGNLRSADIDGDLWPAAVAAEQTGVKAVLDARGVPKEAKPYVDKVKAYAAWYAEQPQFSEQAVTRPVSTAAAEAVEVPAALVEPIKAAGKMCPQITPAQIAAQLRTLSGFDVNKRTSDRQGVAQFTTAMWEQYRPGTNTSVWRPADAIAALGVAMCDMTQQLSELDSGDPYRLALSAYQWGIDPVRRAGGLPRVNVSQLADEVPAHIAEYERDGRLSVTSAKPSPSPSASQSPQASASQSPSVRPSSERSNPAEQQPKGPKLFAYEAGATYRLVSSWAGAVVELPGINMDLPEGTRVHLWNDEGYADQRWKLYPAPDKRHVIIVNAWSKQALGVEDRSLQQNAKMAVYARDDNDENQQWLLEDVGAGNVVMTNRRSGQVMELLGEDLGPTRDNGTTWNGYWVEQLERRDNQRDQKWRFMKQ
ncbi:RICIN domain-containing protein [Micromonospora sp. WMMD1219]|uniref:RICIN domain-containing protein n=1 Tax=Micromonospora sp. WMMD1219 TaxID=3404115 RepID=UPI003BF4F4C2